MTGQTSRVVRVKSPKPVGPVISSHPGTAMGDPDQTRRQITIEIGVRAGVYESGPPLQQSWAEQMLSWDWGFG